MDGHAAGDAYYTVACIMIPQSKSGKSNIFGTALISISCIRKTRMMHSLSAKHYRVSVEV